MPDLQTTIIIDHPDTEADTVRRLKGNGGELDAGLKLKDFIKIMVSGIRRSKVVLGINSAKATGTVAFDASVEDDTIVINGTTLTAKDSPAGEAQFASSSGDDEDGSADSFVTKVNAHSTLASYVSAEKTTTGVNATATLDLTTDIVLTSVSTSDDRNTATFTIQVSAAAANPTDTILATFTGTAAAITVTIVPNDGTNNSATPVNLTTAELVELINAGTVTGKTVTVTDASSLRALQTAAGGDATNLADSGEGDAVAGTFSGGVTPVVTLSAKHPGILGNAITLAEGGSSYTVSGARLSGGDQGNVTSTHYYGSQSES